MSFANRKDNSLFLKTGFAKMQTNTQEADNLNDLRFVAAVAETGSLSGAARRLGVNHATAFRRINAFEAVLGTKLFERSAGHYVPTVAGEELARTGAEIERAATESLRRVAGHDLRA